MCVERHLSVYKCCSLESVFSFALWYFTPLGMLHHMVFGLFHKIQMPSKIPGSAYHPNAKHLILNCQLSEA